MIDSQEKEDDMPNALRPNSANTGYCGEDNTISFQLIRNDNN